MTEKEAIETIRQKAEESGLSVSELAAIIKSIPSYELKRGKGWIERGGYFSLDQKA